MKVSTWEAVEAVELLFARYRAFEELNGATRLYYKGILTNLLDTMMLKARLDEAKWWTQHFHNGHTRGCTFDNAIGDEGDFCSCGLAARRKEAQEHIADLERRLAVANAKS